MRILTFVLGAVLTAYCAAGAVSDAAWKNDVKVDAVLCKFLLCNNAPLVWRARSLAEASHKEETQLAIELFQTALKRDAQDPYRWADLGEAFFKAGREDEARYSYDQVLALAPRTAPLLLRVADFRFRMGDKREALSVTAGILALIPNDDAIVFNDYTKYVDAPEDVLRYGIPEDPRATQAWLRFLMHAGRADEAQHAWDWASRRGHADDTLAGEYLEFLIRRGHPDTASSVWMDYTGPRAGEYGKSNYVFNGDFEEESSRSPFDWRVADTEGVKVSRDCTVASSGKCALRIDFAGSRNLDIVAASQLTFVRPGSYRLRASIRTEAVSTDQGIRFRISDAESTARLDEVFGQFTGSVSWTRVAHDLLVEPETRLLRIEIIRQPSLKFDNRIGGVAFIDDVTLEPIPAVFPR